VGLIFYHLLSGFFYAVMKNLIHVQVCNCAAYSEPFRKHYFNQS